MKTIKRGLLGVVLQAICLAAFIEISLSNVAEVGKPLVVLLSVFGVLLFLLNWLKQENRPSILLLIPAVLAVGYIIAFHLVALLGFPGLLADAGLSAEYAKSLALVTAVVFACYSVATGFLYLISLLSG